MRPERRRRRECSRRAVRVLRARTPLVCLTVGGVLARFVAVTAAPLGCGAVSVWLTWTLRSNTLHEPSPTRGCSSAGRALHSHCRGQGFDPPQLHDVNFRWRRSLPMMQNVARRRSVGRRVPMTVCVATSVARHDRARQTPRASQARGVFCFSGSPDGRRAIRGATRARRLAGRRTARAAMHSPPAPPGLEVVHGGAAQGVEEAEDGALLHEQARSGARAPSAHSRRARTPMRNSDPSPANGRRSGARRSRAVAKGRSHSGSCARR